jgi:hypothetical protein
LNKYVKNGLLIIVIAVLGGLAGLGVSKLLAKDEPKIEIKQQTIKPISKEEVVKKSKFLVIAPNDYFHDKKINYYIFPDQRTKVDYEVSNEPVSSLDIADVNKTNKSKLKDSATISSSFGTMHIIQDKEQSFIWFDRDKTNYRLIVQNKILPSDKGEALEELKKIALSFKSL